MSIKDVTAGLTLGVVLIPQAMAYGMLAGVPPEYGLYAAVVPLIVYTLLSSTPHVSVGPTALAGLLVLNGIAGLAEPMGGEYVRLAIVLASLTGIIQLVLGAARLGVIITLLSRPVITGFVSAAAVLIIASQIAPLAGIRVERSSLLHENVLELIRNAQGLSGPTLLLGLICLSALLLLRRYAPRLPAMLIVLLAASLGSFFWGFAGQGIGTVGEVPAGFMPITLPIPERGEWLALLPSAAVIALMSFVETMSIGKTFAVRHKFYRLRADRELLALGASKLAGSFFAAIPTSASFSRSAVVEGGGARGRLAGIIGAAVVVVALLFLSPAIYYVPVTALAAIIIYSVYRLFDYAEMLRLWRLSRREWSTLVITFLFTLFFGLQWGIAGGVLLSFGFVLLRAARPHLAELGRVPGTNAFRNIERFPTAEVDPDVLIVRFDAALYFGNAEYFGERIDELARAKGEALRLLIIDAHTIHEVDTSGIFELGRLRDRLAERGVTTYLTGAIGPVRDLLFKEGLMHRMGTTCFFLSIQDALAHWRGQERRDDDWGRAALQHG